MGVLEDTLGLLKKYNIKANKSLGQNFLVSDEVVEKIVNSSNVCNSDLIIEIGPGLGVLTNVLLYKANKVVSIELDEKMVAILQNRFSEKSNFRIINEDVLKVDLLRLIEEEKKVNKEIKNVKVVANLPYYITTPIIMKLLEEELPLESITVMVQKEVADRLIATPGKSKNTGAITYRVYYYAEAESVLEVPSNAFIPEPEVKSKVIKLNLRKERVFEANSEDKLFFLIKCAFLQRRKTLLNSLVNSKVFCCKEEAIMAFEKLELNLNVRPENLSLEDYIRIADHVF